MEDTRNVPVKFSSRRSGSIGLLGNNVTVDDDETGVNENDTPWKHNDNCGPANDDDDDGGGGGTTAWWLLFVRL